MLREYLSSLANKFRQYLGAEEKINAQDFENKIGAVYDKGSTNGYNQGKTEGYQEGKVDGYQEGNEAGYTEGLSAGYDSFYDSFNTNPEVDIVQYDFLYAGGLWNDINFPKYDIIPARQNLTGIFYNSQITDLKTGLTNRGLKIDFTSQNNTNGCKYLYSLFRESTITHIPALSFPRALQLQQVFYNCKKLHTIDELDIGENITYIYQPFVGCSALENVAFKGTLKCNGLNLTNATKLSKASIESLINILSASTSGLTVTLSSTAVKKAFETSSDANDGNESDEWKNLIATKSNWTITLA